MAADGDGGGGFYLGLKHVSHFALKVSTHPQLQLSGIAHNTWTQNWDHTTTNRTDRDGKEDVEIIANLRHSFICIRQMATVKITLCENKAMCTIRYVNSLVETAACYSVGIYFS